MNEPQMKNRTKQFALRILKVADALPTSRSGNAIANQIVRSSTLVAANYRALCRAKSRADFINKTSIVEEEADESSLIVDAGLMTARRVKPLLDEDNRDACCQPQDRYRSWSPTPIENRKLKIEN